MSKPFPYDERAKIVAERTRALHQAAARRNDGLGAPSKLEAAKAWHVALDLAYPPGFWEAVAALKRGDAQDIDMVIGFFEADPIFFRSGYAKAEAIRAINRHPFSERQARRLRGVLLNLVARRDDREFRKFCRLASRVATREFVAELAVLAASADRDTARRPRWMLAAIPGE